jgi:SAM-dependent methyltransferase
MSINPDPLQGIQQNLELYYKENLEKHGKSSQGVGWKNDQAQKIRFEQLAKVFYHDQDFSVNDLGCGTGDFFNFLSSFYGKKFKYYGYDIMEDMISIAKEKLRTKPQVQLLKIISAEEMMQADYTVASGIFNLKFSSEEHNWLYYILSTLKNMDIKSKKGFAFNILTKYSDKDYMQDHLYYADPCFLFDYCKRNFSKNVALLHDYDQYDFTIIVRK